MSSSEKPTTKDNLDDGIQKLSLENSSSNSKSLPTKSTGAITKGSQSKENGPNNFSPTALRKSQSHQKQRQKHYSSPGGAGRPSSNNHYSQRAATAPPSGSVYNNHRGASTTLNHNNNSSKSPLHANSVKKRPLSNSSPHLSASNGSTTVNATQNNSFASGGTRFASNNLSSSSSSPTSNLSQTSLMSSFSSSNRKKTPNNVKFNDATPSHHGRSDSGMETSTSLTFPMESSMSSLDQSPSKIYTNGKLIDGSNSSIEKFGTKKSTESIGSESSGSSYKQMQVRKVTNTPKTPRKELKQFESYMSLEEVQHGLKRGELIEGVLRINPKHFEDAYISVPGQTDIYLSGIRDRNRALNGDVVIVQLQKDTEWKIMYPNLMAYAIFNNINLDFAIKQTTQTLVNPKDIVDAAGNPQVNSSKKKCRRMKRGNRKVSDSSEQMPLKTETVLQNNTNDFVIRNNSADNNSITTQNTDIPVELLKCSNNSSEMTTAAKHKKNNKKKKKNNKNKSDSSVNPDSNTSVKNSNLNTDPIFSTLSDNISFQQSDIIPQTNVEDGPVIDTWLAQEASLSSSLSNNNQYSQGLCLTIINNLDSNSYDFVKAAFGGERGGGGKKENKTNCKRSVNRWSENASLEEVDNLVYDINEDDDDDKDKCTGFAVPPDQLSGDEFSNSCSDNSAASHELDQRVEDIKFIQSNNNKKKLKLKKKENDQVGRGQKKGNVVVSDESQCCSSDSNKCSNNKIDINNTRSSNATCSDNLQQHQSLSKKVIREDSWPSAQNIVPDFKPTASAALSSISQLNVDQVLSIPNGHLFIQKTAKVVYIQERVHSRAAAGELRMMPDKNPNQALFCPRDHCLPRMYIPMSQCPKDFTIRPNEYSKTIFVARIVDWKNTGLAQGQLCKSLGLAGEIEPETEAMLMENGVDFTEFPDCVTDSLPKNWKITEEELKDRQDFRQKCVFTIDPKDARDLDDAVSCVPLGDGKYLVGVHIADVSHFLKENSLLDCIASRRATSVYLVHKVIPMLPRLLCEQLCSLNPGEDRLTFSVEWVISEEGDICEERFMKSVINSCVKLSYNHAQAFIENPSKNFLNEELPTIFGNWKSSDIRDTVLNLQKIAINLRKKRFVDGALRLDQPKLAFQLSPETGMPIGFSVYELKDSNRLIEEFMLLANMAVAHQLHRAFPNLAFLRRHPEPDERMLTEVMMNCQKLKMHLDISSSKSLHDSMVSLRLNDPYADAKIQALTQLLSKPMKRAVYFCSGSIEDELLFRHYALSVPLYTHFTSPIRRYPDVIVHRQLTAILESKQFFNHKDNLQKIASNCNDKKNKAKNVQDSSSELFLAVAIKECGPFYETGIVCGVMDRSFDVLILKFGVIKRVYCEKLPLSNMIYSDGKPELQLFWSGNSSFQQNITLFTLVEVKVESCQDQPLKFEASLICPAGGVTSI